MNQRVLDLIPSSIRRFSALAAANPGCIDLTLGQPDLPTPEPIREAVKAALDRGRTGYAPNQGTPGLRRAIAAFETKRGLSCESGQVLVTPGATGALYTALMTLLTPGDEVILLRPAFPLYESILTLAGAKPVWLDILADPEITVHRLEALRTEKTRAVLVNSPCNPTGGVFSHESMAAIAEFCKKHRLFAVCDNVYMPLSDPGTADLSLLLTPEEGLVYCQSLSKSHAMTGWRIGWVIAREDLIHRFNLCQAAQLACLPTFVQDGAEAALQTDVSHIAEAFRLRRQYLEARLRGMGLSLPPCGGGFYAFPDIRPYGIPSERFCRELAEKAGVAAVPGDCFGAPGFIRLSACREIPVLEEAMDRLEHFLNREKLQRTP